MCAAALNYGVSSPIAAFYVAVGNGLECLAELVSLEPDLLVMAVDNPWGGGDGVIARLNDGLPVRRKPLIFAT